MSRPLDFIRDFLKFVDKNGIYDEFDKASQKMVTSAGVQELIKEARSYFPKPLGKGEAAILMRNLTDAERDMIIASDTEGRIVDMRKEFREKMSKNDGAMGLVERLVKATEDPAISIKDIILDAQALIKGPENVFPISGQ